MYVYWWHVGGLRAVKVGHGDDPRQRASDDRGGYGLSGRDVRSYRLESGTDTEWVEKQLRRMLETRGFRRIALRMGNEEEELFDLGDRTFEDAHELLHDAIRHIALAEFSNQRKQRRRHEPQVPQRRPSPAQERETHQAHEGIRPQRHRAAAPSLPPVTTRFRLHLIGAIVLSGLVAGLSGDDLMVDARSTSMAEQQDPPVVPVDGGSSARPMPDTPCTITELSKTLIRVNCASSWAAMRWNGQWDGDAGHDQSDAVAFFNASDMARRVVVLPSRQAVPQLPDQADVQPERALQQVQPVAPAAPPPLPPPRPAAPRAATVKPQPPPLQETPVPRKQCTVSRPKPGFQVYLVTCPSSQVTIGRTVDSSTGWTVSESVNGTEAIEFFMKSPYAR